MRRPWIVLVAACCAVTGFGVGRFTATPEPVPDRFEIKSAGFDNRTVLKINTRTGQTWSKNEHGNWTPMH